MGRLCQLVVSLSLVAICASQQDSTGADTCEVSEVADTLMDLSRDFVHKAKYLFKNCDSSNVVECPEQPIENFMDCADVLRSGEKESGVYSIWPRNRIMPDKPLKVYCDMETDGGGWTVIQRRGKFSTPANYFYKEWKAYKKGFGNIEEEFWIGNDNIYAISNQANYNIRFDMKDANDRNGYAVYDTFWTEDEDSNYTLHIDDYTGDVGDSMMPSDNAMFSTKDRNNEKGNENCAVTRNGAWWWNEECKFTNLNGLYYRGQISNRGVYWYTFTNTLILNSVEIKLRPVSQ